MYSKAIPNLQLDDKLRSQLVRHLCLSGITDHHLEASGNFMLRHDDKVIAVSSQMCALSWTNTYVH